MPLMDDEMKAINDIAQQVLSFSRTALSARIFVS